MSGMEGQDRPNRSGAVSFGLLSEAGVDLLKADREVYFQDYSVPSTSTVNAGSVAVGVTRSRRLLTRCITRRGTVTHFTNVASGVRAVPQVQLFQLGGLAHSTHT